jgi:hypothetical protein
MEVGVEDFVKPAPKLMQEKIEGARIGGAKQCVNAFVRRPVTINAFKHAAA